MRDKRLAEARKLIEEKHYNEARTLLKSIDHPTAQKWLDQLNQIAPEQTRPLSKLPDLRQPSSVPEMYQSERVQPTIPAPPSLSPRPPNNLTLPPSNMSFKVLSQKDKWFSGKFDPDTLEQALNSYAEQSWKLKTSATATIPSFGGTREEIIFILERPSTQQQERTMFEYKVLSQKDKWFSGKFDPNTIEEAINAYAEQGWRVIQAVTATIPGFTGNREEMIIILERPKSR
ncbi:MAG: DUF4177 domain-containing protein [Chloroflexota bacterium]